MTNNYTNSIRYNHKNHTIEITKKFDNAASRFGTDEFRALQEAIKFAPEYRIVVKATKSLDKYKGLTYSFMEKYIKAHDEDGSVWDEYQKLRGYTVENGEVFYFNAMPYGQIKVWFLAQYPEIDNFNASRREIIAKAKEARRSFTVVA